MSIHFMIFLEFFFRKIIFKVNALPKRKNVAFTLNKVKIFISNITFLKFRNIVNICNEFQMCFFSFWVVVRKYFKSYMSMMPEALM